MVGIREGTRDNLPRIVPFYFLLIYQDAHQLGNGKRRMSLVGKPSQYNDGNIHDLKKRTSLS